MCKSVRNVLAGIPLQKQAEGVTLTELKLAFVDAGYGYEKIEKRIKECKLSALIQTNGEKRNGEYVFYCVYWPLMQDRVDVNRVGLVEWLDRRNGVIRRIDGNVQAWFYPDPLEKEQQRAIE